MRYSCYPSNGDSGIYGNLARYFNLFPMFWAKKWLVISWFIGLYRGWPGDEKWVACGVSFVVDSSKIRRYGKYVMGCVWRLCCFSAALSSIILFKLSLRDLKIQTTPALLCRCGFRTPLFRWE
jgi:hypothetical protein